MRSCFIISCLVGTSLLFGAGLVFAQATSQNYGFGHFSPPTLRKPPVSGMLSLTPTTVQPRTVDLGPQTISLGKGVTPSDVRLNQIAAPAPAMPNETPQPSTATIVADQKPTGIWAPSAPTNWLAIKRQSATSILDKPPTPTGLGNSSLNKESEVDWRVVAPVDVPMVFVPFTAPKPTQEPNHWINPPATGPKTPKYEWK